MCICVYIYIYIISAHYYYNNNHILSYYINIVIGSTVRFPVSSKRPGLGILRGSACRDRLIDRSYYH